MIDPFALDATASGSLIFRETSAGPRVKGKKNVIVFGVMQVDKDFPIKNESQAVAIGSHVGNKAYFTIHGPGKPLSEYEYLSPGASVEQILYEPIWKVGIAK